MDSDRRSDAMRYILGADGFIKHISFDSEFEVDGATSTEYSGTIPSGYDSLEEWAKDSRINSYVVQNGNLVHDSYREAYLENQEGLETDKYQLVRKQDLSRLISISEAVEGWNMYPLEAGGWNEPILCWQGSSILPFKSMQLDPRSTLNGPMRLITSNFNLLPNELTDQTINGITFQRNSDKSIRITGTATATFEVDLAGGAYNTKPLMALRIADTYILKSVLGGTKLRFYEYDGVDRTMVMECSGNEQPISANLFPTQITIRIEQGYTFDVNYKPYITLIERWNTGHTQYFPEEHEYWDFEVENVDSPMLATRGELKAGNKVLSSNFNPHGYPDGTFVSVTGDCVINMIEYYNTNKSAMDKVGQIADYITEKGTSGIWKWCKWSSGKRECWGTISSATYNYSMASGSLYYTTLGAKNFPTVNGENLFSQIPDVTVKQINGNGLKGASPFDVTKDKMNAYLWCSVKSAFASVVKIHAVQPW